MMIKTDPEPISALLKMLACELKSQNLWQTKRPSDAKLNSTTPFCYDTLAFEQWLQFIFIPKLTMMINQQQRLPSAISLTPMAEEAFNTLSLNAKPLLAVIQKIDKKLTEQGK